MSTTVPPQLAENRLKALEIGNAVRIAKAALKDDVRKGRRELADLLLDLPGCFEKATVLDLLMLIPYIGRVKALDLLRRNGFSTTALIRDLSPARRTELSLLLPRGVAGRGPARR